MDLTASENYLITFRDSKPLNVLKTDAPLIFKPAAKEQGFDAIRCVETCKSNNMHYNSLALINHPEYLKPTGVYFIAPNATRANAISLFTIRGIQGLGAAGSLYSLCHAGMEIINSDHRGLEAIHQGTMLAAAISGGMVAGAKAMVPCATVGEVCPPAAPYTVPICMAGTSLFGDVAATILSDVTWNSVSAVVDNLNTNID